MRRMVAVTATVAAVSAYLALALLISTAQTRLFMIGFAVCLFGTTSAYIYAILGPSRPHRRNLTFRLSGVSTMLSGYLVVWYYWGGGDGPFAPFNGLFASRIIAYCAPSEPGACIVIQAWLWFAAFVIASLMLLWPLKMMMTQSLRVSSTAESTGLG